MSTRSGKPSVPRAGGEPATERVRRLLTLVPWLSSRPGISIDEAAAGLGISAPQLRADLDLIWVCGYGQMPDELIDVSADGDRIVISNAETIGRPLRLGMDEAITLMVGLRALAAVPGLDESGSCVRALAKLEEAAGAVSEAAKRVVVSIDESAPERALRDARRAISGRRRIHVRYLVPSRDESTERDVDPMVLHNLDSHWYLEGWCHRAQDTRLFRLDRVEELTILDQDGTAPHDARRREPGTGTFVPGADDIPVTLSLDPGAVWVSDYYPVESVTDRGDGGQVVTLRTGDLQLVSRLVLRLGGAASVLSPATAASDVRERAREALRAYEPGV